MSVKKVLVLAANPKDTNKLALEKECRLIEEALRLSRNHGRIIVESVHASTFEDFRRAILNYRPFIVHFCGHSTSQGIILNSKSGNSQPISLEVLTEIFEILNDSIHAILLNACFTYLQAKAICEHINFVVGTNSQIIDHEAIEFTLGFYDGIGGGLSIENAFKLGVNAVRSKESNSFFGSKRIAGIIRLKDLLASEDEKEKYTLVKKYAYSSERDRVILRFEEADFATLDHFNKVGGGPWHPKPELSALWEVVGSSIINLKLNNKLLLDIAKRCFLKQAFWENPEGYLEKNKDQDPTLINLASLKGDLLKEIG